MSNSDRFVPPAAEDQQSPADLKKWVQYVGSGSGWLFLIAALSAVNSIISVFGGDLVFVVGLGITQLIDAFGTLIAAEAQELSIVVKLVSLILSLIPSVILALFGFFGRKAQGWAFIIAAITYGMDAILVFAFSDVPGGLFHLLGLFYIIRGAMGASRLKAAAAV